MRLDLYLSQQQGISRNRAQFLIDQGLIQVNGQISKKSGMIVTPQVDMIVVTPDRRGLWVSRSAVKLDDFLSLYHIDVSGVRALDIGSSTGGFTQVLLERGAQHVTAVEIGTFQLHESLRGDDRISLFENTDIALFARSYSGEAFDIIVADVSWCPLVDVIKVALPLLSRDGVMILLYKPQFEVSADALTRGGVVRDQERRIGSLLPEAIRGYEQDFGVRVIRCDRSTLCGEAGNQEYLLQIERA